MFRPVFLFPIFAKKKDVNINKSYKSFKYRSEYINNGTTFNYANTSLKNTLLYAEYGAAVQDAGYNFERSRHIRLCESNIL